MKNLMRSYVLCLLALVFCMSCNNKDDDNNGPDSPLTPDECKEKLENAGLDFMKEFNPADHKTAILAVRKLQELLDNADYEENDSPISPILPVLQSIRGVVGENDMAQMMALAMKESDIERLSDYFGIFTYNESKKVWDKTTSTDKLEFRYKSEEKQAVVTVTCAKTGSVVEDVEIPATAGLKLTVAGKDEIVMIAESKLTDDNKTGDAHVNLVVATYYNWDLVVSAKSNEASVKFMMAKSYGNKSNNNIGKMLITASAKLTGNKLTDPDFIDSAEPGDVLSTGEFHFTIMNVVLNGNGDIKAILDGMDKIKEKGEAEAQKEAEVINQYAQFEMYYTGNEAKIADVKMAAYLSYLDENQNGKYNEYDIEPRLIFTQDKSEYSFETYFSKAKFGSLIDAAEKLANDYGEILGFDPVEL